MALSLPGSAVNYDRALLTLRVSLQDPNAVVKLHGFDVKWRQDAFFVLQWCIINIVLIGWQNDTHVAEVDVDSPQICPTQRCALWEEAKERICYCTYMSQEVITNVANLLHVTVNYYSKWVTLAYSLAGWRFLESCEECPTPASNTQVNQQTQCASARGSESCSLSEAWQSCGDQSMLISHLQICTQQRDHSEQSWLLHSGSKRKR